MPENKLIIKKRGMDDYKTFSIRIREDLVVEIEDIASKSDRSRNEIIGMLLEYAIRHAEIR